jgi:S-adenosylmethionine:tRNA-ribosyltransferase-isomerase (queuine synthetase)
VRYKTFSENSNVIQILQEVQSGTTNIRNDSNFIPKELLYMKNNRSKYELILSAALRMPGTDYSDM